MGELLAIISAGFYGMAGITIQKGRETKQGDGGVFLSIVFTALFTGLLWGFLGSYKVASSHNADHLKALLVFAGAGILATVFGRLSMFRSTELIGPVSASMLRRMIPLFAVPLSIALIGEWPGQIDLMGGGLILAGVYIFSARNTTSWALNGITFGLISAFCYAASYTLRKYSLNIIPDPFLGTFIGAIAGLIYYLIWMAVSTDPLGRLRFLTTDTGPWFLITAMLLSLGQMLQLIALQISSVAVVSFVGSMDILFSAIFASIIFHERILRDKRFLIALALVLIGTGCLAFW